MSISLVVVGCSGNGASPRADGSTGGGGGGSGGGSGGRDGNGPDANAPDTAASDANAPDANSPIDANGLDASAADATRDAAMDVAAPDASVDGALALDAARNDGASDRAAVDAAADRVNDAGSDVNVPRGCGPDCRTIQAAYSEAIMRAKSCTGGDQTCALKAEGSLGCLGCPVWVSDKTELDALSARFSAGGCAQCFFGSPTGDRCHPQVCPDLGFPMCAVGASGRGTCVDRPKDRTCPAGTKTGSKCTLLDDYCVGGGEICFCDETKMTWSC